MRGLARAALRPVMLTWSTSVVRGLSNLPRPIDYPHAHAPGIDADRILVVGSGAAVGWGVMTHDLALPGTLARAVTALTGHGTDVDVISEPGLAASRVVHELQHMSLWRYDAIVLTLGLSESAQLNSARTWRTELDEVLTYLHENKSHGASVFLLGVHAVTRSNRFDAPLVAVAREHRVVFNRVSAEECARDGRAIFVPFDGSGSDNQSHGRKAHNHCVGARMLSVPVARELDAAHEAALPGYRDQQARGAGEAARQLAVDELDLFDGPADEELDRIVSYARRAFGTSKAALTVIDRDRQFHKVRLGFEAEEVPRAHSFCATTILGAGALVVPDATQDDRFKDSPLVTGESHLRFYAGFPVEAPNGERVGALCVFDEDVREVSDLNLTLLRELALRLQRRLWDDAQVAVAS